MKTIFTTTSKAHAILIVSRLLHIPHSGFNFVLTVQSKTEHRFLVAGVSIETLRHLRIFDGVEETITQIHEK